MASVEFFAKIQVFFSKENVPFQLFLELVAPLRLQSLILILVRTMDPVYLKSELLYKWPLRWEF